MTAPLTKADHEKIVYASAIGQTVNDTAVIAGVSPSSVTRLKRKPEIRAKIEAIQERLATVTLDKVMKADEMIIDKAVGFLELAGAKDLEDAKVLVGAYQKLSKDIRQTTGISPAPAQSIFVQHLYQDASQTTLNVNVANILSTIPQQLDTPAIDLFPEDEDS